MLAANKIKHEIYYSNDFNLFELSVGKDRATSLSWRNFSIGVLLEYSEINLLKIIGLTDFLRICYSWWF